MVKIKNNHGWMKIVEATVAILLVVGVLLVVINQGYLEKKDVSSQIYDIEVTVLREIQLDDSLREDILSAESPVEWDDTNFPETIKEKINLRVPSYLECKAKICQTEVTCDLEEPPKKEIYSEKAVISTILETPEEQQLKQLKLFCWIA